MKRVQLYAPHIYYFFFFSAAASYGPFLGYWFREAGLGSQQIGLLYAIGPFVALFVQPFWGVVCDKYGMEKAVLMLCSLLTPAIAFGYSGQGNFVVFAATAFALALFNSPMVPLADAIAVAHAQKHKQTYGGARVWGSIGFAMMVIPVGQLYAHVGIERMFVCYMVLMTVVFGITALLEKGGVRRSVAWRDIGKLLARREFAVFLLLVLLVACGTQSFSVFFSVYVGETGGNVSAKIGWLTAVSALSELPFFLLAARLTERFGYRRILALSACAGALRFWLVSLSPSMPLLLLTQSMQGITFALFYAAGVQFAFNLCPPGWKTTAQTLFSMVYTNLAILTASNLGGWLINHSGFGAMFRMAGVMCALGGIGFLLMRGGKAEAAQS